MKDIKFFLTLSKEKILSVNELYKAGLRYVGNKAVPYIYKNPKSGIIESEIRNQLLSVDFSEHLEFLKKCRRLSISISFILRANLMKRDVQNLDKQIIDVITKFIKEDLGISHFDDSLFLDVHFSKSIIPGADNEYIAISITESGHNERFDIIPSPNKVFIEGEIKPAELKNLKKNSKEYNLKLKFYSDEEKRLQCNTEYLIVSPNPSLNLGRTLLDIYNKVSNVLKSETKFLWIGFTGDEIEWGNIEYKLIQNFIEELNKDISGQSKVKIKIINDPSEIIIHVIN